MRQLIIASLAAALACGTAYAEVTEADLAKDTETAGDVLTNGMGRHLQRHSPLATINKENVKKIIPVWAFSLGGEKQRGQETQPLVHDGIMYIANPGAIIPGRLSRE